MSRHWILAKILPKFKQGYVILSYMWRKSSLQWGKTSVCEAIDKNITNNEDQFDETILLEENDIVHCSEVKVNLMSLPQKCLSSCNISKM